MVGAPVAVTPKSALPPTGADWLVGWDVTNGSVASIKKFS